MRRRGEEEEDKEDEEEEDEEFMRGEGWKVSGKVCGRGYRESLVEALEGKAKQRPATEGQMGCMEGGDWR